MMTPPLSTRSTLLAFCFLLPAADLLADSWQMTMQSKDGQMTIWIDEDYGLRIKSNENQPVDVLMRIDTGQTIMIMESEGVHALAPDFSPGGGPPHGANAPHGGPPALGPNGPPGAVPGGPSPQPPKEYQKTGETKKIGKFTTEQVIELVDGQPSGLELWVANIPDWPKIAAVFDKAMPKGQRPDGPIDGSFAEIGGIPIASVDPGGRAFTVTGLKKGKLTEQHMSPNPQSREVDFVQMMLNMKGARPGGPPPSEGR